MDERIGVFQKEFNEVVRDCQRFCFATRAKEFQLQACEELTKLKEKVSRIKAKVVATKDNDSANCMLSFEEMINALINELKMWVALKEDDPNSAWDFLVDAQHATRTAMQAHEVASHLEGYSNRLLALEQLLFPPQLFVSIGVVIQSSKCSICGQLYGECDHVAGKAYMGKMCGRIIEEIQEAKEISFVKEPGSKRHRAYNFTDGGVTRDIMTWRSIPPSKPNKKDG
ncbi:MAG: hypothetical protein KAW16_01815 [candidate division Zixibacteria bacterium]|nr:hypothetical protein [candidate division Zixibacteria bacterium]